ncbi:MAG: hypothetical protein RR313_11265 [Anaerovoracaceae bacterium]
MEEENKMLTMDDIVHMNGNVVWSKLWNCYGQLIIDFKQKNKFVLRLENGVLADALGSRCYKRRLT